MTVRTKSSARTLHEHITSEHKLGTNDLRAITPLLPEVTEWVNIFRKLQARSIDDQLCYQGKT